MARFTKKLRRLLLEETTDTTLREIDALFGDNDIQLGPPHPDPDDGSVRRERTRRYLASIDTSDPADLARLTAVLNYVIQDISRRRSNDWFPQEYFDNWVVTLRSAGFVVDPETFAVSDSVSVASVHFTDEALSAISNVDAIQDHLARLSDTVDKDPRLAVSTAKALIESTAKIVLSERGESYSKSAKLPALVSAAQESLGLAAKSVSEENASLRRVLQSLVTLTQGVTEIRNQAGIDHGAEVVPKWVRPRHARLVVGAAQVWCQLMLETLADPAAPWRSVEGNTETAEVS